jgi:hypothetical protein
MRDTFDPAFAQFCDELAVTGAQGSGYVDFDSWRKLVEREKAVQGQS